MLNYLTEILLALLTAGITWVAGSIYRQSKTMAELLRINKVQTETIDCHSKVMRNIIRALRSLIRTKGSGRERLDGESPWRI